MIRHAGFSAALAVPLVMAAPSAYAAPGDPGKVSNSVTIDPIIDLRLRYEAADTRVLDADSVTFRVRSGAEIKHTSGLSLLAESEATLAMVEDYNAFPFAIADSQRRTGFAVVADPMTVELNRLQLQYKSAPLTVTVGRQRINLDDQRFVGAVGWRQNEQTFDALRGEGKLGPVMLDATYANSQRTIFGSDAGTRTSHDGAFVFLGAGGKIGPISLKAFGYLLDYDADEQLGSLAITNADTQTFGVRATGAFKLAPSSTLNLAASYARQSDWKTNPVNYAADYIAADANIAVGNASIAAGYERLGSDNGRAVQTPLATLHKFNGWADVFLTTPAAGLEDIYAGVSYRFTKVKAVSGLNAGISYHRFNSDVGNVRYGDEWNASLGFKLGRANLLAKYADYNARSFGADIKRLVLQLEVAY